MANEVTTYLEKAQIDYFLRPGATAPTRPTSVKVGLLTAITDAEAGTVTEAAYAGYAAQDAGFGASANNGGLERTSNAAQIDFPAVVGTLAVVGYGIKDHLGNWLVVKAITTVNFNDGDIPRINAGGLTHDQG
jgi:hypothetical protein